MHRHRFQVLRHIVAPHHVENDVGLDPLLGQHGHEVLVAVIDGEVGTQIEAGAALLVRTRRHHHDGAKGLAQHDRRGADAARPAMHQQGFAFLQPPPVKDIGPHREEGFRDRRRLGE